MTNFIDVFRISAIIFALWYLIGSIVLAFIDKDKELYNYTEKILGDFAFLAVVLFPITAYLYLRKK